MSIYFNVDLIHEFKDVDFKYSNKKIIATTTNQNDNFDLFLITHSFNYKRKKEKFCNIFIIEQDEKIKYFKSAPAKRKSKYIIDVDKAEWSNSCKVSSVGTLSQYIDRIDWWYLNASQNEDWKKALEKIYGNLDFRAIWQKMRFWLTKKDKNRRNDLNRTFRKFIEGSL